MFPTFISILDIQSWWEVPSIAHFCSLFRTAFNLLDFDIEDLEEALLSDGTEESSWLQELIVRLLSGCLPNNEISTFNYQMFLRRLFRQKCQEHDRYNPFNTDCDFTLLPLRTKVDILHALCDFRLDAEDVLDQLKNLEADSLRVEPLGYDGNDSAYWYFYGTRLYREDFQKKNNKKKSIWQVICFTEEDWFQLTKKFKNSVSKPERALYHTLSKNFLPELPRLFKEKERQARKRLLENQPRRTSDRLRKLDIDSAETDTKSVTEVKKDVLKQVADKESDVQRKKEREFHEKKPKVRLGSEECQSIAGREDRHEMAARKKGKTRQRRASSESSDNKESLNTKRKKTKNNADKKEDKGVSVLAKPAPVGRQTNNSLSAADGQIVIQSAAPAPTHKKKLKTSQVFQQSDEDLQVGMHKILDFVKNHDDAWPFVNPVEEEYAPNYYSIIRRPMDLTKMEDRLDQGYYKNFDKFKSDFQLIVNNCRLYNGVENEYTEMVDNLLKVFEKATEKYLDQISSSDEEIAVENLNTQKDNKDTKGQNKHSKKKKLMDSPTRSSSKGRKLGPVSQSKKKERSPSIESAASIAEEVVEEKTKKSKVKAKESKKEEKQSKKVEKETKENKKTEKELKAIEKDQKKIEKEAKKVVKEKEHKKPGKVVKSKKEKAESKKENKSKEKEEKSKKRGRKKKKNNESRSRSRSKSAASRTPSPSPVRSMLSTPPPSSPDSAMSNDYKFDFASKGHGKKRSAEEPPDVVEQPTKKSVHPKWNDVISEDPPPPIDDEKNLDDDLLAYTAFHFSQKPKDKHNKLRETIEKLKAKSEILRVKTPEYDFEVDDHLKENKDKNKKVEKDDKNKPKHKEKLSKPKKNVDELEDGNSSQSENNKKPIKRKEPVQVKIAQDVNQSVSPKPTKQSNFDALSLATEQTLKDINKWLDATPSPFVEFSSASNSPPYLALDDFDLLGTPKPEPKKADKPPPTVNPASVGAKKEGPVPAPKEVKKKPFRDPSKFFNKRREVQRTIDRLQPGKSKGNLISSVQSTTKTEEIFPLGPLSKVKDTKNSLIVKTDLNAPKLSLGSVLDSFGKHKFVDDPKKEEDEEKQNTVVKDEEKKNDDVKVQEIKSEAPKPSEIVEKKEEKETKPNEESCPGGPTPNLSAWFKAFGAPKAPPPLKKPENKPETKEEESSAKSERVPVPDPSPSLDSPQPVARQRRISTGSSMSERSSFSQDLDSPRVGMDERGAYPAPYPSPLHRSPSSASPVMASPRPDISPRSAYPFNGQMRVGFYQDTVSNKSSPDKSCSPRDNLQSPYYNASDHVYAPNTTQNTLYSYANSPYYTHPSNYSSTNPTPPYNTDVSSPAYYDTNKGLTDQYSAKPSQNYTANSPASSQPSPANQPQHSPHSPIVHPQMSPSLHSQHSPGVHSQHSPSVNSPQLQSPNPGLHSPGINSNSPQMSVHSPQVNSPNMQHSPGLHSPNMVINSPHHGQINSPVNPPSVESLHHQQDEGSSSSGNMCVNDSNKAQQNVSSNQPVFPVKKRAFVENELSQFCNTQNELVNRSLQIGHQLSLSQNESDSKQQMDNQGLLHQQALLQQQQLQKQVLLRQAQQSQQMLQQQNIQMQKNHQLLQHQQQSQQQQIPLPIYSKSTDTSLSTPSPPLQSQVQQLQEQMQQQQLQQQQLPAHSTVESSNNLQNMPYSTAPQSNPYTANFNSREAYTLNIPSTRTIQQHQSKLDMSKFTNMGYTGPDVNFSRALQHQYDRTDLNYTRTTVPSAISQPSQLLSSQPLSSSQQSSVNSTTISTHNKQQSNQPNINSYQGSRSVDTVAERLTAQVQQDVQGGYKPDMTATRANYNSSSLEMEQRLNLGRNISNIVGRYSNEQRMMGLQSSSNPYYTDKGLGTSHMFNKTIPSTSQIFSQANMTGLNSFAQSISTSASIYSRQINELQAQAQVQAQVQDIKTNNSQAIVPDKKTRKKKSSNKSVIVTGSTPDNHLTAASLSQSVPSSQGTPQGFQSYAGLKAPPSGATTSNIGAAPGLEPGAISLKTSSVVPGSAFNFGPGASGPLALGTGVYADKDAYSNFLDDYRAAPNFFMGAAAVHHRSTPENPTTGKNGQGANSAPNYPSFLNPAHQGRPPAYSLGSPFIAPSAQAQLMDGGSQLYQHYIQAGLNQGLLGPAGHYPSGYHPALTMRQPFDSISRPSWM
ncbi:CECR2 histone acetyl-lysine reader dikar isoform X2 [Rhynchophorus ferrugineus]|uniref:CECR2 histone acetyl-lysine reader dikar isoform X2 n=1 Tax=Rhynchophorus ferrugineus TaxID=354439 RepID=UPI003FCED5D1